MLSMYCEAASGYFIWYSLVSPGLLWQAAQVLGRLSLKTGESACLAGRIPCEPWQSAQPAAPEAPRAWLAPWMLVAYSLAGCSWQAAQFTGLGVTLSSGCF